LSIAQIYDFRGGYAADTPPEQMADNMVQTGTNLYYDAKLKKRPSFKNWLVNDAIDAIADDSGTVVGMCCAYMNSAWQTVLAIDNDTATSFYTVTNATTISSALTDPDSAAFTFTKDHDVNMVAFDGKIVAVNADGTDKPAVIYYDGTKISIEKLEEYDSRSRGNDDWYAGQWDDDDDPTFEDDTTDAQDAGANDFAVATATNNDGFYVAGVLPFTKIVLTGVTDLGTSVTAEYCYYAGSGTWTDITSSMVTVPDWVAAEGNKTIEFNIPLDSDTGDLLWEPYGDVDTQTDAVDADGDTVAGSTIGRYIFRVRFTTADTAGTCDTLTVSHEQYLTQLFQGDYPNVVAVHNDRCYLACGSAFAKTLGGINGLKGWASRDFEYTDKGGENIIAMYSGGQFLAIVKELGFYRYYGTTTANAVLRYGGSPGGVSARGICALKDGVAYLGKAGVYYMPYDGNVSLISKAISSDLSPVDGDSLVNWEGNLLVSDPSADTLYWGDPDTLRQDDMGDYTLSWWKWTGNNTDIILYDYDAINDSRTILAYDGDNGRIIQNGTDAYDTALNGSTQTNISCTLLTKYYSFGTPNTRKRFIRVKVDLSYSGNWTLTMYSDNGANSATAYTIASGTGTTHYYEDISIPYELDGYNIAFQLANQTANAVEIYGFSVDYERRVF